MPLDLPVLYEDNHLLVVDKPAGLATMGSPSGEPSVVTLAAAYLKARYAKPGNVFVGVVSRLDRMVSGVLVLARTSKAAARLSEEFRQHKADKRYLAWVEGAWQLPPGTELIDWISKDESAHRMRVVGRDRSGAQVARLLAETLHVRSQQSLLGIQLLTGRKHQIRVQLAARGHAIVGDRKYEASTRFFKGIALHAHRLTITHPTRRESLTFEAPVPDYWPSLEE